MSKYVVVVIYKYDFMGYRVMLYNDIYDYNDFISAKDSIYHEYDINIKSGFFPADTQISVQGCDDKEQVKRFLDIYF